MRGVVRLELFLRAAWVEFVIERFIEASGVLKTIAHGSRRVGGGCGAIFLGRKFSAQVDVENSGRRERWCVECGTNLGQLFQRSEVGGQLKLQAVMQLEFVGFARAGFVIHHDGKRCARSGIAPHIYAINTSAQQQSMILVERKFPCGPRRISAEAKASFDKRGIELIITRPADKHGDKRFERVEQRLAREAARGIRHKQALAIVREQVLADAPDASAGLVGCEIAPVEIFAADFVVKHGEDFVLKRAAFARIEFIFLSLGGAESVADEKLEWTRREIFQRADGGGEFVSV